MSQAAESNAVLQDGEGEEKSCIWTGYTACLEQLGLEKEDCGHRQKSLHALREVHTGRRWGWWKAVRGTRLRVGMNGASTLFDGGESRELWGVGSLKHWG